MSQTAAANDSACPPLTNAVSMTIITRVLFTLLKQMELVPSGFKESFTCKSHVRPVSAGAMWFLI